MKTAIFGLGRRKTSVARVKLIEGSGKIIVNNRDCEEYFNYRKKYSRTLHKPFNLLGQNKWDALVNAQGGGLTGQAEAILLGISRALEKENPDQRVILKKNGCLSRDPRMVERKKPGLRKARRAKQFSKR